MDDLPDALGRFAARLEMLERRVFVLEHPQEGSAKELALEAKPAMAAEPRLAAGRPVERLPQWARPCWASPGPICCEL